MNVPTFDLSCVPDSYINSIGMYPRRVVWDCKLPSGTEVPILAGSVTEVREIYGREYGGHPMAISREQL